jgi:hypothetical protein
MKENKMSMRTAGLIPAIALALGLGLCANSVRAGQPTRIPAYYNGQIDYVIPGVSTNVLGVQSTAIATRVANPIYVILPVSEENAQPIDHVLGVADPGVAGYNPYWDVIYVTVLDGRDLTNPDNQFTSEDQILLAAADPTKVKLTDTGFILLCQVVSK